jgi:leucyl-tRNA synthetase
MYSKNFLEIDNQYQEKIESNNTFSVDNIKHEKPTYYVLDMFAYPS